VVVCCNYTEWIWRLKLLFGAGPCCKKRGFTVLIQNVNWPQTVTLKAVKPTEQHRQECAWRSAAITGNLCWLGHEMGISIRNTQGCPLIFWGSQVCPQKWGVVYQPREHFALCANVFHRRYQTADGMETCITNNTWTHEDLKLKNWQGYYKPESGDTLVEWYVKTREMQTYQHALAAALSSQPLLKVTAWMWDVSQGRQNGK